MKQMYFRFLIRVLLLHSAISISIVENNFIFVLTKPKLSNVQADVRLK